MAAQYRRHLRHRYRCRSHCCCVTDYLAVAHRSRPTRSTVQRTGSQPTATGPRPRHEKRVQIETRMAITRKAFELCPDFKSLPPVLARELSIDLTWGASGPKPEFPAPEIGAQSRCAQGERGVNCAFNFFCSKKF